MVNKKNGNRPSRDNTKCIEAIKESMTPEEYQGFLKGSLLKSVWGYDIKNGGDLLEASAYLKCLSECADEEKVSEVIEIPQFGAFKPAGQDKELITIRIPVEQCRNFMRDVAEKMSHSDLNMLYGCMDRESYELFMDRIGGTKNMNLWSEMNEQYQLQGDKS